MTTPRTLALRATALIAAAGLLAACGRSDDSAASADTVSSVTIDGQKVTVDGPLRLAVFVGGTGNAYSSTLIKTFKSEVGRIPGAKVTIFDGKFDATTQINQLTNAVQGGRFNAFSVGASDPRLACDVATKLAPKNGILVVAELLPLCDRASASGADLRAPGTLSFVGGPYLYDYFVDYLEQVATENPGAQKVVVLNAPALNPINVNLTKAIATVQKAHPDFRVTENVETDFTSKTGNEKAASLLQAHPDTTIIFSAISDLTKGATAALSAAGQDGKAKVYDISGDTWDFDALRKGTIQATALESPSSAAKTIVAAIVAAREGRDHEPFYLNDGAPLEKASTPSGLTLVTKENVDDFTPQY